MEFCEKCGSMTTPRRVDGKVIISCPKCGEGDEMKKEDQVVKEQMKHDGKESLVVIENPDLVNTMPTKPMKCSKCNKVVKTQYWAVQTRSGDEAATRFYRCTKCKHTWREYD